jgi:hypothetical protein
MLLEIYQVCVEYSRLSKQGKKHTYTRNHKMARLVCDSCARPFERRISQIDPRRLTVNHTHVCSNCNPKQFAQRKGVESRRFWNTTVDLDKDIDSL